MKQKEGNLKDREFKKDIELRVVGNQLKSHRVNWPQVNSDNK